MARPKNKITSRRVSLTGFVSPALYGDVLRWLESLPTGKRFVATMNILSVVVNLINSNPGKDVDEIIEFITNKENVDIQKFKRSAINVKLRFNVFKRDGYRCVICGRKAEDGIILEIDHIKPVSKGGLSDISNLQTLCMDCNRGKSNRSLFDENNDK
ncbi:MAG: HNH endonuclease [Anaerolineales bacterium]|nr:HNH endonuclease [Anaerolineales bacterium]